MVPCAQGRVIVERTRPAPPHFATCSSYRRPLLSRASNNVSISVDCAGMPSSSSGATDHHHQKQQEHQQQQQAPAVGRGAISKSTVAPLSPAARPDDLSVTPWYLEDYSTTGDTSPRSMGDRSSYPSYLYAESHGRLDLNESTRNTSIESDYPRPAPPPLPPPPPPPPPLMQALRKAYMDLGEAMALLDETCPNVEPSPSLTPRTPRTPLTPYTRNKRARSKSSDNSSNYSNDRLSNRSFETTKDKDKDKNKEKKRPFLRKIGISKTEDRSFLAKFTPRIKGKPYLEKIGPSKAVERPFLDKIGSSRTLDKFTFETPRKERRNEMENEAPKDKISKNDGVRNHVVREIERVAEVTESVENVEIDKTTLVDDTQRKSSMTAQTWTTCERRRSGKEFLLKMYSFETEDLESTVPTKDHRDPLRGTSLDDVLDSGPSSLPTDNGSEHTPKPETEIQQRPSSRAELLKCRVTTSEEIISFTTYQDSPGEANSCTNSPHRTQHTRKDSAAPVRRRVFRGSREILRSDDSTPNSPIKRPISSVSPDREIASRNSLVDRGAFSPTKTRKSIVEDIRKLDSTRKSIKYNQFERRGISSDNLLTNAFPFVTASQTIIDDMGRTREISSEDSLATRHGAQEYTRETFKQLQDKFKLQEIPTETYAAFKRRTRAAQGALSRHERLKMNLLPAGNETETPKNVSKKEDVAAPETNATETTEVKRESSRSQEGTVRSVLRKQEKIDQPGDIEADMNASIRRPKRRIFHEPSQETMDLLTELRKVKSLLKTPSWEKINLELDQKPTRTPKRILLTDKEFCLSVERENSVRRPSRMINSLETTQEGKVTSSQKEQQKKDNGGSQSTNAETKTTGPALFEKRCMSLDYADEEKPQKPETRAISLGSTRNLPSEAEEIDDYPNLALTCDSKSYSSDVFNCPLEEANGTEEKKDDSVNEAADEPTDKPVEEPKMETPKKPSQNHCAEVDIAIPIDQKINSPKEDVQGRTSDLYEIISPRSTPFRVKKRLGKISVEEAVKPENFTLGSKVDCRSVVAQKRTKCFPL